MIQRLGNYRNTAERFWERLDRSGECWTWSGAATPYGYGKTTWRGVHVYAHRLAFELANGAVPEGMFVCHRCDNPTCCRPDHLFLGTPSDNVADRDEKGRHGTKAKGVPRLTNGDVIAARRRYAEGEHIAAIARSLGRSDRAIWAVVSGRSRRNVTSDAPKRRCA